MNPGQHEQCSVKLDLCNMCIQQVLTPWSIFEHGHMTTTWSGLTPTDVMQHNMLCHKFVCWLIERLLWVTAADEWQTRMTNKPELNPHNTIRCLIVMSWAFCSHSNSLYMLQSYDHDGKWTTAFRTYVEKHYKQTKILWVYSAQTMLIMTTFNINYGNFAVYSVQTKGS